MEKDLQYDLKLPYTIQIRQINDKNGNHFYARVVELDGCQSDGETIEDAYRNIREAMEGYISVKLEYGDLIPKPKRDEDYSGKFVLRLPKSLHRELAERAKYLLINTSSIDWLRNQCNLLKDRGIFKYLPLHMNLP